MNVRAILSASNREQFLKQLEQIVEGVQQSRTKIDKRQQEEKSKRDVLNIQLAQLIEKARQYAKVLKDFQEVNSLFNRLLFQFIHFRQYETTKASLRNPNEEKKNQRHCSNFL